MTKGDNNPVDDRGLYPKGTIYLREDQIIGKAWGMIPYGGYLTILLTDYPMFKYTVLGIMCLQMVLTKDPN